MLPGRLVMVSSSASRVTAHLLRPPVALVIVFMDKLLSSTICNTAGSDSGSSFNPAQELTPPTPAFPEFPIEIEPPVAFVELPPLGTDDDPPLAFMPPKLTAGLPPVAGF